ncbi:unnamed protein product [Amoebophrya sp. A120]|nr:unnamed protein product [Amoebophrya sp. A120]|eukprot:GSA120T00017574001.1
MSWLCRKRITPLLCSCIWRVGAVRMYSSSLEEPRPPTLPANDCHGGTANNYTTNIPDPEEGGKRPLFDHDSGPESPPGADPSPGAASTGPPGSSPGMESSASCSSRSPQQQGHDESRASWRDFIVRGPPLVYMISPKNDTTRGLSISLDPGLPGGVRLYEEESPRGQHVFSPRRRPDQEPSVRSGRGVERPRGGPVSSSSDSAAQEVDLDVVSPPIMPSIADPSGRADYMAQFQKGPSGRADYMAQFQNGSVKIVDCVDHFCAQQQPPPPLEAADHGEHKMDDDTGTFIQTPSPSSPRSPDDPRRPSTSCGFYQLPPTVAARPPASGGDATGTTPSRASVPAAPAQEQAAPASSCFLSCEVLTPPGRMQEPTFDVFDPDATIQQYWVPLWMKKLRIALIRLYVEGDEPRMDVLNLIGTWYLPEVVLPLYRQYKLMRKGGKGRCRSGRDVHEHHAHSASSAEAPARGASFQSSSSSTGTISSEKVVVHHGQQFELAPPLAGFNDSPYDFRATTTKAGFTGFDSFGNSVYFRECRQLTPCAREVLAATPSADFATLEWPEGDPKQLRETLIVHLTQRVLFFLLDRSFETTRGNDRRRAGHERDGERVFLAEVLAPVVRHQVLTEKETDGSSGAVDREEQILEIDRKLHDATFSEGRQGVAGSFWNAVYRKESWLEVCPPGVQRGKGIWWC